MDRSRHRSKGFILYLLILIATCAAVAGASLMGTRPGYWLVTLGPILLVEIAVYNYYRYWLRQRSLVSWNLPGAIALGTIIVLYAVAVLFIVVFIQQMIHVSLFVYGIIHLVTALAAAAFYGAVSGFNRYVERQEADVRSRTARFKQIQHHLAVVKQELSNQAHDATQALMNEIRALEEKVKYSDPFSHPSLRILEDNLQWQVDELVKCVQSHGDVPGNVELSFMLIRDISKDLTTRNGKLHTLRQGSE
ncbi:hypothetical protein D3C73_433380 [compost metagenome]